MYDYESTVLGEAPAMTRLSVAPLPPVPQPIDPVRRMPIKTRRVEFEDDYAGWWAVVRTNAPFGTFLTMIDMVSGNITEGTEGNLRAARAMGELVMSLPDLVRSWNFVDESGAPLPCDLSGMKRLPKDLLLLLVNKVNAGDDDAVGKS